MPSHLGLRLIFGITLIRCSILATLFHSDPGVNFSFGIRNNLVNSSNPIPTGYHRIGDMILPSSYFQKNGTIKSGVADPNLLWPGALIPYRIDDSLASHFQTIQSAMDQYHAYTCIKFIPAEAYHTDYILLIPRSGCYSMVGRQGYGMQEVSLGRGCTDVGTIVHELGHSVGLFHEHSRSDREFSIKIHMTNVDPNMISEFQIIYGTRLLNHYDINSIMHYGSTAFSKDGKSVTMEALNGADLRDPFQKLGLDSSDIWRINTLYQC